MKSGTAPSRINHYPILVDKYYQNLAMELSIEQLGPRYYEALMLHFLPHNEYEVSTAKSVLKIAEFATRVRVCFMVNQIFLGIAEKEHTVPVILYILFF